MTTKDYFDRVLGRIRQSSDSLRPRQLLGKYKIQKLIATGGFARIYSALDTIEGVHVALKLPFSSLVDRDMLELFRQEARTVAKLDHPHILPIKNADFIEGQFVIVTRLGVETLDARIARRISAAKALNYFDQMISAVAWAHHENVIHCDIKPENFILFPEDHLRLTDFGIAKVSRLTVEGSGTGTVGFMAPEQAMGRPNKRSDVFSLGLIMYRMLTGAWPNYPFDWPPPSAIKLRRKRIHPELIALIRKAIEPRPNKRFASAVEMEQRYEKVYPLALRHLQKKVKS